MRLHSFARSLLLVIAALGGCMPPAADGSDASGVDAPARDSAGPDVDDAVETGTARDDSATADAPNRTDRGDAADAGAPVDVAAPFDRGVVVDAGTPADAGTSLDAGTSADAGTSLDVGTSADAGVIDVPRMSDAGALLDAGGVTDAGAVVDVADSGLPPIDAWGGALPAPSRTPADWGPLRVTTRTASDDALVPVERLVYGYSARRVNYVDTERWGGSAWVPYERSTYAYTTSGAIDARIVYRSAIGWTLFQRFRYEYNADGTVHVVRGDVRSGSTWGELTQTTWEWAGGLPAWQRHFVAPAVGVASVRMWENTFEYDANGRFTSFWRLERSRPTDALALAGRRTPTVRATGHVDRETFSLGGVDTVRTYRYDAAGALLEVADRGQAERYVYDLAGHLRFVRTYVATDGAWSLATEVEIEGTDEGGDLTWALDPFPYETWRRDRYGRGNLVDRYRR